MAFDSFVTEREAEIFLTQPPRSLPFRGRLCPCLSDTRVDAYASNGALVAKHQGASAKVPWLDLD